MTDGSDAPVDFSTQVNITPKVARSLLGIMTALRNHQIQTPEGEEAGCVVFAAANCQNKGKSVQGQRRGYREGRENTSGTAAIAIFPDKATCLLEAEANDKPVAVPTHQAAQSGIHWAREQSQNPALPIVLVSKDEAAMTPKAQKKHWGEHVAYQKPATADELAICDWAGRTVNTVTDHLYTKDNKLPFRQTPELSVSAEHLQDICDGRTVVSFSSNLARQASHAAGLK